MFSTIIQYYNTAVSLRSAAYFDAVVKLERFQDVAGLITGT